MILLAGSLQYSAGTIILCMHYIIIVNRNRT